MNTQLVMYVSDTVIENNETYKLLGLLMHI